MLFDSRKVYARNLKDSREINLRESISFSMQMGSLISSKKVGYEILKVQTVR